MTKIRILAMLAGVILGIVSLVPDGKAQEAPGGTSHPPDQASETKPQKPVIGYRLEFILIELEDGKKINARAYSMLAQDDGTLNKLRVGSRIPVPESPFVQGNPTEYQFHDIGVNIDCRLQERESGLMLDTTIDTSNISQPIEPSNSPHLPPVVHQLRAEIRTLISPGKATLLGSMDDPTSRSKFDIEVTATKLK